QLLGHHLEPKSDGRRRATSAKSCVAPGITRASCEKCRRIEPDLLSQSRCRRKSVQKVCHAVLAGSRTDHPDRSTEACHRIWKLRRLPVFVPAQRVQNSRWTRLAPRATETGNVAVSLCPVAFASSACRT